MKPSPSIGGMSLDMDQQHYDIKADGQTNEQPEERGKNTRTDEC